MSTPYSGPGNLVEPLSNGLRLEMTDPDIRQLLGPPPEQSWDARTYSYPGLQVQVGGRNKEIWDIALTSECVRLHSGIGVGSSRDEVRRTYGAADEAVTGSYKLTFTYSGNVVARVRIEPAGESFRGVSGPSSTPVQNSRPTESESAASAQPGGQSGDGLAGRWYCVSPSATVGIIAMDGRGHYTFGANSGTYQTSGMSIRFSGIPWNGGQAQIVKGNIEFYYSDARGYKYYFAFARY